MRDRTIMRELTNCKRALEIYDSIPNPEIDFSKLEDASIAVMFKNSGGIALYYYETKNKKELKQFEERAKGDGDYFILPKRKYGEIMGREYNAGFTYAVEMCEEFKKAKK